MTDPACPDQTLLPVHVPTAGEHLGLRPPGYRPAVVVDANALISDAIHRCRLDFSLMTFLAEQNIIALATAAHIDEKVYARLPVACRNAHADLDAALEVYETHHRPRLRLVSMGELMLHDERVATVALTDPEDVPVAQLGVLLAPSLVLTQDKHLVGAGIGVAEWADALSKLKELMELEETMRTVAEGAAITSTLAFYGVRGLIRALMRSEVVLGVTLAAALGLGYLYREQIAGGTRRLKEQAGPVTERAMAEMTKAVERWRTADSRVRPTLVRPYPTESLETAVARVLLPVADPQGAAAIQSQLPYPWRDTPVAQLMDLLREHSAFELVRGRGWTLGHAALS